MKLHLDLQAYRNWWFVLAINTLFSVALTTELSAQACQASLNRIDKNFCISNAHALGSDGRVAKPLSFSWSAASDSFDLEFDTCFSGSDNQQSDVLIAIDRAQTLALADSGGRADVSRQVTIAKQFMAKLSGVSDVNVGLVLFSGSDECSEWTAGSIPETDFFPCVYIPMAAASDSSHRSRLNQLLDASMGKYSSIGLEKGTKLETLSQLMRDNLVSTRGPTNVLLLTDGMAFENSDNDEFSMFKMKSFIQAQRRALESWREAMPVSFRLIAGLSGVSTNTFGGAFVSSYENMCALQSDLAECENIDISQPLEWPVNNLSTTQFLEALAGALGGSAEGILSTDGLSTNDVVSSLYRYNLSSHSDIQTAHVFSTGTGELAPIELEGAKGVVRNLKTSDQLSFELRFSSENDEWRVPLSIKLNSVAKNGLPSDQELQCNSQSSAKSKKKRFVGGSMCGVAGSASSHTGLVWILGLPLLFILRPLIIGLVLIVLLFGSTAFGDEATSGINLHHYRPALGGIAGAEQGYTIPQGSIGGSLSLDYAKGLLKTVEEADEDDQSPSSEESVVDSAFVSHATLKYGLLRRADIGLHIPFIVNQTSSISDTEKEETDGSSHLGDAELFAKYWAASWGRSYWGVMPAIRMASGQRDRFSSDGQNVYSLSFLGSGVFGRLAWSMNVGYRTRSSASEAVDEEVEENLSVQDQALFVMASSYRFTRYLTGESGIQHIHGLRQTNFDSSEVRMATRWHLSAVTSIYMGAATGIGTGAGSPLYRVITGLRYLPSYTRKQATPTRRLVSSRKQRRRR